MIVRAFWLTLGFASLILGFIGVFLPVLPTTPFVLLAAFSFSKSSKRLHQWIRHSPLFGPPIRDWQDGGVIRPPAKRLATFFIVLSFSGLTFFSPMPLVGKIVFDVFAAGVLIFIWSRPSAKVTRKGE